MTEESKEEVKELTTEQKLDALMNGVVANNDLLTRLVAGLDAIVPVISNMLTPQQAQPIHKDTPYNHLRHHLIHKRPQPNSIIVSQKNQSTQVLKRPVEVVELTHIWVMSLNNLVKRLPINRLLNNHHHKHKRHHLMMRVKE